MSAPPIIDEYETLTLNYDRVLQFQNIVGSTATIVTPTVYQFIVADLPTSAVSQRQKFYNYLNYFQEYRVKSVTVRHEPRFKGSDLAGFATLLVNEHASTVEPETRQMFAAATVLQDSSFVTYIPDRDDTFVTSTLDEYWQVRASPDSITFPANQPHSFTFVPSVLDVMAAPTDVYNGAPKTSNPFRGTTINNLASTQNQFEITSSVPQMNPWTATKAVNSNVNTATPVFNDYWVMFGYKKYLYTPMNQPDIAKGFVTADYALQTTTVVYEFRKPDYRPYITNPVSFAALNSASDLAAMDDNEDQKLENANSTVSFISPARTLTEEQIKKRKITMLTPSTEALESHRTQARRTNPSQSVSDNPT